MNKFDLSKLSKADAKQLKDLLNKMSFEEPQSPQLIKNLTDVWVPETGDVVYIVTLGGVTTTGYDKDNASHRRAYNHGLLKETREEAEYLYNHRYICNIIETESKREQDLELANPDKRKYGIGYDVKNNKVCIRVTYANVLEPNYYFRSKRHLEKVIEELGANNILKYYFPYGMVANMHHTCNDK